MRTLIRFKRQGGSALLVTLTTTVILGTALASYLKLVQYQNTAVVRSQVWNSAMPLCEAGIEEALTHLNTIGDDNRASNGWEQEGNQYHMNRTIGSSRYEVWINSSNQPSITAVGYVTDSISQQQITRTVLVTTTKFGAGMRGIIAKEGIHMNGNCKIDSFDSEDPAHSTYGRYDEAKAKDNGYAGSVYANVNAEGDGVWGHVGTGAHGNATGNVGDFAWLASNTGIQPGHYNNDLNVTFPDVQEPFNGGALTPLSNQHLTITNYTYLQTQTTSTTYPSPEPASGVVTNIQSVTSATKPFSWSGTLTTNYGNMSSTNYPAAGTYVGNVTTRTVVSGHGHHAVTITYYDYTGISGYTYNSTTYTYNTTTTNATTSTSNYSHVTDSGNYQLSSLTMSGQNELLVRGDTVLYITGEFSMAGQSQITILPGASLKLYLAGNASLSGNGIMNLNQDATKFSVYGLPSCTSFSLSGNAAFTGTIYAPNADMDFNGGGNNVYDCVGAVVAKSADFNGHFHFHYDEKLGRVGGKSQFRVAYWSEI
jgi:hypothetical protein